MPYGAGQIAAVEQLIRRADAAGDGELAFAARMLGHHRRTSTAASRRSPSSPSPGAWPSSTATRSRTTSGSPHTLLWHFKYMVNAPAELPRGAAGPDVRGARRHGAALPRRRAQPAGRLQAPAPGGPTTSATPRRPRKWYRALDHHAPRRPLRLRRLRPDGAGRATSPTLGRDEEAVALAEPVLAGRLTCVEQPQAILTALLLPYLRTGRRDAARDAHRTGVPAGAGNLADLGDIGEHVEFCARDRQRGPRAGDRRAAPGLAGPGAVAGRGDAVRRGRGAAAAPADRGRAR